MLELGQPNHTYDLDLVPDGKLVVRKAKEDEEITTLDDTKRKLSTADIAIVNNADEVIGIAGVMGGASTEISDNSTKILLEAAVWDRMSIAKTSRRLNLRSEASTRFERGVDYAGSVRALDRFCELAQQICGAKVLSGVVSESNNSNTQSDVTVRVDRVNMFLAAELTGAEIKNLLDPIGYKSSLDDPNQTLQVQIPSWRPDSSIEEDVIEEVARLWGYDKLAKRVPKSPQSGQLSNTQKTRRYIRRSIEGLGLSEAMPMPFLAPNDLAKAGLETDPITLANPLVSEESILRTSLLPGLLKAISYNQSHRIAQVSLYEMGTIFKKSADSDSVLPEEQTQVALIGSGFSDDGTAVTQALSWLDSLKIKLRLKGLKVNNQTVQGMHPTRSAVIEFRGKTIGEVGEVDPQVLTNFNVEGRMAWLRLNVQPIVAALSKSAKLVEVSRFPTSDIDLAFMVPTEVGANQVLATIEKAAGELLLSARLFDVFRGEDKSVRSLAYSLRLQAKDKTLSDQQITETRNKCIKAVQSKFKATLRE